jgi:sterol desaturase/sphingolipid hydroxylase (fatty acid hydroxylase superfamily)
MMVLSERPALLGLFLVLIALEFFWRVYHRDFGYDVRGALASLGVAIGQIILRPLGGVVIVAVLHAAYQISPLPLPAEDWRVWLVGFFAVEFAYYWFHRSSHLIRWLWATHSVHHSATELVLPSALRLGWTEFFSGGWLFFAALARLNGC